MRKVLIVYNESGGGHKQTARVLAGILVKHGWQVNSVSVFKEVLPDMDLTPKIFGVTVEDLYNRLILKNEANALVYRLFFFLGYFLLFVPRRGAFIRRFRAFFSQQQPDLIISVIPLMNPEMATAAQEQDTPFFILQTDLFEYDEKAWGWRWVVPHGAWFVRDEHTWIAVGTEKAYQQALKARPNTKKLFQLSGSLIDPRFLTTPTLDIALEREKLGLDPDKPTGLILYGGYPPNRVLKLAQQLNDIAPDVQFIFICGNNEKLQKALNDLPTKYKKHLVGYTKEVPYYMQVSDFLIGKSGPGVIMEGIAIKLPLLLDVQRVVLHEGENAPWVEEQGLGLHFKTAEELHQHIQQFTSPEGYQNFKQQVSNYNNQACFEIPEVIERIVQTAGIDKQ